MKRVLLVATTTGYQIRSFGEAAETLGVRLVFASDRCDQLDDPWWDQAIPVRFHEEARSVDAVRRGVRRRAASTGSSRWAIGRRCWRRGSLARFGLPGHPPEAAAISRNKLATREALQAARACRRRGFVSMPIDGDPAFAGAAASLSRRRQTAGAVGQPRRGPGEQRRRSSLAAFDRLRRLLAARDVRLERDEAHGHVLVESFIPGTEYAVEGLLDHGTLQTLAIFDKPDPLDGPFFEETIYRTPSVAPPDDAAAHRRRRSPRPAPPSACTMDRCTPSVAWTAVRHGLCARSRGAADRRSLFARACAFDPAAEAMQSRSRRCCCGTRSARTCRPTRAKRRRRA